MGHVYPDSSADPVDIVAWWAERAEEDRKYPLRPLRLVEDADEDTDARSVDAVDGMETWDAHE